eukprot:TRINITY_DN5580_c0_g1_i1.p1 TRINITY_DN5580_c0_g1~~TRINITY_DN5580_c0_g1_i1.p1  ORF type:complete len:394 (+),score=72.89 TRINITY_DN5580_c0_g1_i1:167-1348(+)
MERSHSESPPSHFNRKSSPELEGLSHDFANHNLQYASTIVEDREGQAKRLEELRGRLMEARGSHSNNSSPQINEKRVARIWKQKLNQQMNQTITFNSISEVREFVRLYDENLLNIRHEIDRHFNEFLAPQNFRSCDPSIDMTKNRSSDNLPTLEGLLHQENVDQKLSIPYINAAIMEHHGVSYITTQHPLMTSLVDFWKMILHEKPAIILMLNGYEYNEEQKRRSQGMIKDEDMLYPNYWPSDGQPLVHTESGHNFEVSCRDRTSQGNITSMELVIICDGIVSHVCHHICFNAWQDQSIPDLRDFVDLWRRIEQHHPQKLVVHCIGGKGRTGSFVAIDIAAHELNQSGQMSMDSIILDLRKKRMNMVAIDLQYLFCHRAAVSCIPFALEYKPT